MGIEYELKYAATKEVQREIQRALGASWVQLRMYTTYYDAVDGALSARKWTLRHRLENESHVCTVKTPAGASRGEWEVSCEEIGAAIPMLCKLGAPAELAALTQQGVVAVCGARFVRQAATVEFRDSVLEVALDDGVLFAGDREEPLCEVEVELKSGSAEAADAFAGELSRRFGLQLLKKSKFKRAFALRETV